MGVVSERLFALLNLNKRIKILPFNVLDRKTDANVGNQVVQCLQAVHLGNVVSNPVIELACERGNLNNNSLVRIGVNTKPLNFKARLFQMVI